MGEMTKKLLQMAKENNDPVYDMLKKRSEIRREEYKKAVDYLKHIDTKSDDIWG